MRSGIISVGQNLFDTLLAVSQQEQEQGLMYWEPPTPNMSFVYDHAQVNKFWMANTPAPLDIVFCHAGKISQICLGEPYSTAMIGADEPSDLIIEFPYGTVVKSNIKLGQQACLLQPSTDELKRIIAEKYLRIVKI